MISARAFLLRGLLAGLVAGILAFGVAYVVGEPSVTSAIALEESGGGEHSHADEPGTTGTEGAEGTSGAGHSHEESGTVVPRSLQSTAGLLTATVVAGVTLGGLLGAVSALALGRFGRLRVRATVLLVTGVGFAAVYVVPFLTYPPNPPAVGEAGTIGVRTTLYFALVAVSVIAAVTAVAVGRRLALRWGAWYAGLAAAAGFGLVVAVATGLMPSYDEVPEGFPASLLYGFRRASFLTQLTLWGTLGIALAELAHRSVRPAVGQARALADARG